MNNQQARIEAYLEMAADQLEADNVVDVVLQTNLDAAGYDLRGLDSDLETILANRG